jgi:hypothetical protein
MMEGLFIPSMGRILFLLIPYVLCVRLYLVTALGHVLQSEGDVRISLLERAIQHLKATADYSVFYGEGRDTYDVWGRTAHESIFNVKDGNFRCPNSQQGYTGFSTWTRVLHGRSADLPNRLNGLIRKAKQILKHFQARKYIIVFDKRSKSHLRFLY